MIARGTTGSTCSSRLECVTSHSVIFAWWCPECETAVLSLGPAVVLLLLCLLCRSRSTWGFQSVLEPAESGTEFWSVVVFVALQPRPSTSSTVKSWVHSTRCYAFASPKGRVSFALQFVRWFQPSCCFATSILVHKFATAVLQRMILLVLAVLRYR